MEELRKDLLMAACNAVAIENNIGSDTMNADLFKPTREGLDRLIKVNRFVHYNVISIMLRYIFALSHNALNC